jgi:hypothetical protein
MEALLDVRPDFVMSGLHKLHDWETINQSAICNAAARDSYFPEPEAALPNIVGRCALFSFKRAGRNSLG